eukprot:2927269-Prymnesium_polylepis.1
MSITARHERPSPLECAHPAVPSCVRPDHRYVRRAPTFQTEFTAIARCIEWVPSSPWLCPQLPRAASSQSTVGRCVARQTPHTPPR